MLWTNYERLRNNYNKMFCNYNINYKKKLYVSLNLKLTEKNQDKINQINFSKPVS